MKSRAEQSRFLSVQGFMTSKSLTIPHIIPQYHHSQSVKSVQDSGRQIVGALTFVREFRRLPAGWLASSPTHPSPLFPQKLSSLSSLLHSPSLPLPPWRSCLQSNSLLPKPAAITTHPKHRLLQTSLPPSHHPPTHIPGLQSTPTTPSSALRQHKPSTTLTDHAGARHTHPPPHQRGQSQT